MTQEELTASQLLVTEAIRGECCRPVPLLHNFRNTSGNHE
jgi:hypothetical protein